MSRIGKLPIEIPQGVNISIDNRLVTVNGPKGELTYKLLPSLEVLINDQNVTVSLVKENKNTVSLFGLTRTLIANMIIGVSEGFEKQLEFHGVGYRAAIEGDELVLNMGYSHPIKYKPKAGIDLKVEKNIITVTGISKQLVGQTAAEIREFKKPEPYKGKGIKYVGEKIRRKAGKAAAKAGA